MILFIAIVVFFSIFAFYKIPEKYHSYSIPNLRSSHSKKKISSGGIPIIIAFFIIYFFNEKSIGLLNIFFIFNIVIILIYGFFDDKINLNQKTKFLIQCYFAISLLIYFYFLEYKFNNYFLFILFLFAIFFFNLINFLDGSDGNLSINLIVISCNLLPYVYQTSYSYQFIFIIVSLSIFFIFFNYPPSKMFLGETGSGFFSYLMLFNLLIMFFESKDDLFSYLILFSFIFMDIFLTLIYRLYKYKLSANKGHKDHFYQIIVNRHGHKKNILFLLVYYLIIIIPLFHISMYYESSMLKFTLLILSLIVSSILIIKFGVMNQKRR